MTFVGIVIFTVYAKQMVGSCDPKWSTRVLCADVATEQEYGRQEPQYIGEFDTVEACSTAAGKASYRAKDGERVMGFTEILCVPKDRK